MAKLFQELKLHNKFEFEVKFLVMDPGYSPANRKIIEENARKLNIPITIFESDIFDSVYHVEKSPCYLCARMRRGYLYSKAKELGCNKIALGHHFDDAVETFMMSLVFEGRLNCFKPVTYMSRADVTQIRPLLYIGEQRSANLAKQLELPVVKSTCPMDHTSKRQEIKDLLTTLSAQYPDVRSKVFGAMQRLPLDGWGPTPHERVKTRERKKEE